LNKSGVYRITSPFKDCYVGSALNLRRRWNDHKGALRKGLHGNKRLQRQWNLSEGKGFQFSVLLLCRPEDLLLYEQRAINTLHPKLNICKVAGNSLGLKRSDETRKLLSITHLGKKDSDETRQKKILKLTGRPVSEDTRAKIKLQKGWKHTEEAKLKMRGRLRSDEHCRKLGLAHIGVARHVTPHTIETKSLISINTKIGMEKARVAGKQIGRRPKEARP